jgi:hypothetical protein
LLREAFEALETDLLRQLKTVRLDDDEMHSRLVTALQIAGAVEKHLVHVIQDGAAAVEQISLGGRRID